MSATSIDFYHSPFGIICMRASGGALDGLSFVSHAGLKVVLESDSEVFRQTAAWLHCYFDGKAPQFLPPLRLVASPFRLRVWRLLLGLGWGKILSYGDLGRLARPGASAARAVGGALGANPIVLILPCHRVIASSGRLGGYSSGLDLKAKLLEFEGVSLRI